MNTLLLKLWVFCFLNTSLFSLNKFKDPTVFIAILVRNKAHVLPYFLTLLSRLDYPKHRIGLWIRTDHNTDNSEEILKEWIDDVILSYHFIEFEVDDSTSRFEGETNIGQWSENRYWHMIEMREKALKLANDNWADYVWFLDCDSFITNRFTLKNLIDKAKDISAPLLLSDGKYSNYWCGMTDSYYYKRTPEYDAIMNREKVGCFKVPMVHSAVLINLNSINSDFITFSPSKIHNYNGPVDDIISFAVSNLKNDIPMYICNNLNYGYTMIPLEENGSIEEDKQQLLNLKLFIANDDLPLPVDKPLEKFIKLEAKNTFGFDRIFIINLKRRKERKIRMQYYLDELGIEAVFEEAVDGAILNEKTLAEMGVTLMKEYEDPYYKRPMKNGEIGCFLSHYKIWNRMMKENYQEILILEDDLRFEKNFIPRLQELLDEIRQSSTSWDLIYIGRKIMDVKKESFIEGSVNLVHPYYTYWTNGYILRRQGAQKLINADPLKHLLPVDEFLPIMFDRHPRNEWKSHFSIRDLKAVSVNPLIVFPVKYINEEGYVSDTEDSKIVNVKDSSKDEL